MMDRRQETAAGRVSVSAEGMHWLRWLGEAQMDEARGNIAGEGIARCFIEGRPEAADQSGRHLLGAGLLAADPALQVLDVEVAGLAYGEAPLQKDRGSPSTCSPT